MDGRKRRIPVVLQFNAVDCAAACLAMVLNYFGRSTTLEECRQRCGIGRNGTTAKSLAEAARGLGVRVMPYSVEPEELRYTGLPAIAHWGFNHFVVVERWSPTQVRIIDPAVRRRWLTSAEFDAGFTGVILVFEPGERFQRRASATRSLWWSYATRLRRVPNVPGGIGQIHGLSVLLQSFGLGLPALTGLFVDQVIPLGMRDMMVVLGIGVLATVACQTITTYVRSIFLLCLRTRLDAKLSPALMEHVLSLPFSFFQLRSTGDLLLRLESNSTIRELLTNQSTAGILDGSMAL